jgi:hypothetical protein
VNLLSTLTGMRTRPVLASGLAVGALLFAPATAVGDPQPLPPDESGTVYFQTQDGTTFCYVVAEEVGCSGHFANTPVQHGVRTNGVKLSADGTVEYLVGDLGDLPETTLDYSTFTAAGWTIEATEDGTRFTNDSTGHGMSVSVDEVSTY